MSDGENTQDTLLGGTLGQKGGEATTQAGERLGGLADQAYDAFGRLAEAGRAEGDQLAERLGGEALKHTLDHAVNVTEHGADALRDRAKEQVDQWSESAGDSIER